jgi:hypothetical protein
VQFWCVLVFFLDSGEFWWVLVSSGAVLVCSGGVLVGSGEFYWDIVGSGAVLVCFGGVLVGSGGF